MSTIQTALGDLFVNADAKIQSYGASFTSQDFLRWVIHDQQQAYIDLLVACSHLPTPFDQAHQKIGQRLSFLSPRFGYEPSNDKKKDTNIFGLPTESIVYVRRP